MYPNIQRDTGISLREVLANSRIIGPQDIRVTSCCSDSRRCREGDLFIAQLGTKHDGHDFVAEAVKRGASAVLAERYLPTEIPTCLVPDSREAYGQVCQALAGDPSQKTHVIGVTGTSGKTVTGLLITGILEEAGHRVGVISSLGYCDSIETAQVTDRSPTQPELGTWLARMYANQCSHVVLEASSIALAQRRLAGIELDAACITNIRRDHLDFHGSVLNYRRAKTRLFEHVRPDGFAIVNADDPASRFFLSKLKHPTLTIGLQGDAELSATIIERHKSEQTFLINAGDEVIPVRTHMIGDQHVSHCLAAAAVGLVYGIDLPTIVRGLEKVSFVPGNLERIECGQPYGVFVDQARSPDNLAIALKALRKVKDGRLICVFGADGDRNQDTRPVMGRLVERYADLGILTTDGAGIEPPLSVIHDVLDGYDRPSRAHILPDRSKAICWALSEAQPGDTVLVAGQGKLKLKIDNGHSQRFSDRDIIQAWLRQISSSNPMTGISASQ